MNDLTCHKESPLEPSSTLLCSIRKSTTPLSTSSFHFSSLRSGGDFKRKCCGGEGEEERERGELVLQYTQTTDTNGLVTRLEFSTCVAQSVCYLCAWWSVCVFTHGCVFVSLDPVCLASSYITVLITALLITLQAH